MITNKAPLRVKRILCFHCRTIIPEEVAHNLANPIGGKSIITTGYTADLHEPPWSISRAEPINSLLISQIKGKSSLTIKNLLTRRQVNR